MAEDSGINKTTRQRDTLGEGMASERQIDRQDGEHKHVTLLI